MNPVEVKMVGNEYVGYFFEKEITRGKSVRKVVEKLAKYIKGQE